MTKRWRQIIMLIGDLLILNLALYLTLNIRYYHQNISYLWDQHLLYFIPVFLIWLLSFYIADTYNLNLIYKKAAFNLASINAAIGATLLSFVYFYLHPAKISPKTNLLIFAIIFLLLFFIWRALYNFFIKSYLPKNNLALIGWNSQVEELLEDIKSQPHYGYETALIFKSKAEIENLPTLIKSKNIRTLVLTTEMFRDSELREILFNCLPLNLSFYSFTDFYEEINNRIPIEAIDQEWFLQNLSESHKHYFNLTKRIVDIILAGLILIISLPFWPLIILIIVSGSRGGAFFTQNRVGQNEKIFKIIKFRTMRTIDNDSDMTVKKDRRITSFGGFLRKTRLDEIPQVLNILSGEMSFIGPRPERPEFVNELSKTVPFYKTRLLIKPGLTGSDQISGEYHSPNLEDTMAKLQHDLYYLKHRSPYLDTIIFLKTIATVLRQSGR